MFAISSGSISRWISECGRCSRMNSTLRLIPRQVVADEFADEVLDALRVGRAGDHRVDRDAGARDAFANPRETPSSAVFVTP